MRLVDGGLTNYVGSCVLMVVLEAFTVEMELVSRHLVGATRRYCHIEADAMRTCRSTIANRILLMAAFDTFHALAPCPV